jgi:UDP-GlcNAc:undecaprenyl-phosphate/decaprenyl-phosphate GlcNAc-1-phosphate transferase
MDEETLRLLLAGAFAFAVSLGLTFIVRSLAYRRGLVATPREDRWHSRPTALLGGVAIFAAFAIGWLVFSPDVPKASAVAAGAVLLFAGGLLDDLRPMRPYMKLVLQVATAALIVYLGLSLPWTENALINNLITVFWLVGITNALNLLDNMDGLAAGVAIIASGCMAVTFAMNGQLEAATLPVLLGGAALGFLVFNWYPASIFMGDAGSMFLGVTLGGTALLAEYGRSRSLAAVMITPVLIMIIPILDTAVVAVTRKLSGRSIAQGGRDHTSHRLVAVGLSEPRAVATLCVLAAVSGALAIAVGALQEEFIWLLVPTFALVLAGLAVFLGGVRVQDAEAVAPGRLVVRVLGDMSGIQRIVEVLLDVGLISLAYYGAFVLRYDGNIPPGQMALLGRTLPLVIGIQMIFLTVGGVYRSIWRYVGIREIIVVARSVVAGTVVGAAVVMLLNPDVVVSRSIFVLYALLLVIGIGGSRLSFRVFRVLLGRRTEAPEGATPVLIYGAGDGGELVMREILNNPTYRYVPVGFLDDDDRKAGRSIHGYRVFRSEDLPDVIRRHGVVEILVSTQQVPDSRLDLLRSLGVHPRRASIEFE